MDTSTVRGQVEFGLATEWGDWELRITEWGDGVTTVEAMHPIMDAPFPVVEEVDFIYPMAPPLAKIRDDLDANAQHKAELAHAEFIRRAFG